MALGKRLTTLKEKIQAQAAIKVEAVEKKEKKKK